jgi:hypothetical protein
MTPGLLFLVGLAILVGWAFRNRERFERERREQQWLRNHERGDQ